MSRKLCGRVIKFAGSKKFFRLVVLLFIFQAAWLALSARYPMAFDEQVHFGIIKIYAKHLTPFITSQPPDSSQYGPIAANPSYLYYYVMSFPYRLVAQLTGSMAAQVIALRLINVAFFAGGLVVFRKVLACTRLSDAAANTVMLFFVMIPVVPLLAGQINYDNLLIPLSSLAILWCLQLIDALRLRQPIRLDILARLLVLCLLASLVEYEFLAVAAGILLAIAWAAFRYKSAPFGAMAASGRKLTPKAGLLAYGVLAIACLALFARSYGVDLVRYHALSPRCNQVLSVKECLQDGPFARAYQNHKSNPPLSSTNKLTYPWQWADQLVRELTFTISSSLGPGGITVNYYTENPLPVVLGLTWALLAVGTALAIKYARRLWRDDTWRSFIIISLVYILLLYAENYLSYLHEREPVAIHGRYLFPVLVLMIALGARCLVWFMREKNWWRVRDKALTFLILCLLLTQGGGFITYIIRGNPSWSWPQSPAAQSVNRTAQKYLSRVVVR